MNSGSDFDSTAAVFKSAPKRLAALMISEMERTRLWRPDELAAVFRHQMAAPIVVDLGGFDAGTAARLKNLSDAQSLVLKSFCDLFRHPSPPLELLEITKNFAKANLDHPESSLPSEIAQALYYISIAAALVRLDRRISQLSDTDLRRGLLWAREQAWTDSGTRDLLQAAIEKLPKEGSV